MTNEDKSNQELVNLEDVKTVLGLHDSGNDTLLGVLIKQVTSACRVKLGLNPDEEFPQTLDYIPFELVVKRFNRRTNEGMTSASQDGLSLNFEDDEWAAYASEIEAWRLANNKGLSGAVVTFMNPYDWGR